MTGSLDVTVLSRIPVTDQDKQPKQPMMNLLYKYLYICQEDAFIHCYHRADYARRAMPLAVSLRE